MKRSTKKGFTIVELVIVIAVIAILAAVLIPTFSSLIKKANISSDTQLCKNMNTALSMAKAEGITPETMEEVLFVINDAGYVIENLNPTTEGYYFAWDSANAQIVFLNENFDVHYPVDAEIDKSKCWITVGSQKEANTVAAKGFALYLEPGYKDDLTLDKLVSVDAGVNAGVDLTIDSETAGSIVVRGSYNNVALDASSAHVEQYGVINNVSGTVAANTFVVNGFVQKLNITGGKITVAATGVVNEITEGAKALLNVSESKGIIVTGAPETYTPVANVEIGSKAELEAFRDIVNGGYYYKDVTVKLTADIDLAGVAWTPIGNFYRKNTSDKTNTTDGFMGTFNGNGHTIKNLSNNGFSVAGLKFNTNKTTPAGYSDASYGLFGTVVNATIKNLTVNANIDLVSEGDKLGDSVGAIVGFASETFTMDNCTVNGSVKAWDAAGGLVGRSYSDCTITNCTNNANVTCDAKGIKVNGSAVKAGGIVGYAGNDNSYDISITGCKNTGTIALENTTSALKANIYVYQTTGSNNICVNE